MQDMPEFTILVADDDKFVRDDIRHLLKPLGYKILETGTATETLAAVTAAKPDLVLLDLRFPDNQDLTLLKRVRADSPNTEIIMVSSQTEDLAMVVEAIKLGAYDYIAKPFTPEELANRVSKALEFRTLRHAQEYLVAELQRRDGVANLIGSSAAMQSVKQAINRLSDLDCCVLVTGQSGTGKELVARALHMHGKRRKQPFVAVNCAAIPEALVESVLFGHRRGAFTGAVESVKGRFEHAGEGTIFLDEIGDMPLAQQASLLRVLEYRKFTPVGEVNERECRARFVLATNKDLRERVAEKLFREDLFYRIHVATISVPPLKARLDDLPDLIQYYCATLAGQMGRQPISVSAEAMSLLREYDWPGNVRELRNILESAIMLAPVTQPELRVENLPPEILALRSSASIGPLLTSAERREKEELLRVLRQCQWNQSQAAKLLGCHRNTMREKIRYFGLSSGE